MTYGSVQSNGVGARPGHAERMIHRVVAGLVQSSQSEDGHSGRGSKGGDGRLMDVSRVAMLEHL